MGIYRSNSYLFYFSGLLITALLYQNCGPGFRSSSTASLSQVNEILSQNSLQCDPQQTPSDTELKRLSKNEYFNSVRDLLVKGGATDLANQVAAMSNLVPTDNLGYFSNMDSSLSTGHINGYYQVSRRISDYFLANETRLINFVNSFAGCQEFNQVCLGQFIQNFGLRSFRRPLTQDEVSRYTSALGSNNAQAFREVIFVFLQSPQFLFHLETEGSPIAGNENALSLSSYELASRISYGFLQTTPNDFLMDLAANGSILSESGRQSAINHIFSTQQDQVKVTFKDFYSQWLKTKSFETFQFNPSSTKYDAFLNGANPNINDMIDEVDQMIQFYTWTQNGSLQDMLTSPYSFARAPALANLYGVEPWNQDPNQMVTLPAGERSGLLTRSFFLVSPNEETHPIHRSAFIRRQILCEDLAPPPDTLPPDALAPPAHDPSLTTRQRFEQKTSPGACMGCHSIINPVGFALENFDGLGRFRQFERVFEDDGQFTQLPVDASAQPQIIYGSQRQVTNGMELSELVAESGKADICFAKQIWRYTHKRMEQPKDNCSLVPLAAASLKEGGGFLETLKTIISTPSFTTRYWGSGDEGR